VPDSPLRRLLPVAAIALAAGLYVLDRRGVLAGSGHLLFDLNPAEQGFLRVVAPWLDAPLGDILTDPVRRARFLRDSQAVGNQVHGTLALSATATHAAVRAGAPAGTLTLRLLALAGSTAALVLWMSTLWRRTRSLAAPVAFAALYTVAPAALLKLSLVHWGTHEVVLLLHAALVAALAGGLDAPGRRAPGWALLAGALAGPLTVANASLLLPCALVVAWIALSTPGLGRKVLTLVVGGLAFVAALWLLRESGAFAALGHTPDAPLLPGKRGRPFLLEQGEGLGGVRWWSPEVATRAMPWAPGRGYGAHAASVERWARGGLLALGVGVAAAFGLQRRARRRRGDGLLAFLGLSLAVGWVAVTALSQSHGLDPGIVGGIQPRYYAHLYPVALALVALWASRARWRWGVVGALLFFAGVEHRQLFDPAQPSSLAAAPVGRCDASAAWLRFESDRRPPPDRVPLGDQSDAFLRGLRVIELWQFPDYWRWYRPADLPLSRDPARLRQWAARHDESTRADPDFWRGVGLGLSCVAPRPADRAALLDAIPDGGAALTEGLEHPGAAR